MVGTPAFGGYVALSTSTTAQNKTDFKANLDRLSALFTIEGPATPNFPGASPDFDSCPPNIAQQILNEITALKAIITASP